MTRLLAILALSLSLGACCPCRHLSSSIADSVRSSSRLIIQERLVPIKIPVSIPSDSRLVIVRDSTSHLETNYATSDAWINKDGSLGHSLANKAITDTMNAYVKATDTIRIDTIYRERQVKDVIKIPRELTAWQRFRMKGFWVLLAWIAFVYRKVIGNVIRKVANMIR